MNWEDGKLFLAVARAGQLLGAAKVLGLNQATLSRRMTALEKAMGTKLLVRRTTGCDLTEQGDALVALLERAEGIFLASQALADTNASGVSGTVRIGAPDGFGSLFLAPHLAQLKARHPALNIQLVPAPRSFSLSQREADIAVMVERPTQGRLVARKLTDYSLSLYAAPQYLARRGTPQNTQDLKDHDLVGYVDDLLYAPALNYVREFSPSWRSTIEVATAVGQMEAVNGGGGIGIVHDFLVKNYPNLISLMPETRTTRSYWTVIHENLRDLPRITAVTDFIAEIVAQSKSTFIRR